MNQGDSEKGVPFMWALHLKRCTLEWYVFNILRILKSQSMFTGDMKRTRTVVKILPVKDLLSW